MLTLVHSSTSKFSNDYVYEILKNRDKSKQHIIIVPDRCAFNAENMLFDKIGSSCVFDIRVLSLSRLTSILIDKYNMSSKVLSKLDGVAIIKKTILDHDGEFVGFGKGAMKDGFANMMFEIISLLKSNNIAPSDIKTDTGKISLDNKMQDIKYLYSKYEEYLTSEFTDSFNRMDLFCKLFSDKDFVDTSFYFMCFDDFTKQGYNILHKLMTTHNVTVATTLGKGNNNKNIYLNNVYYELIDIANKNNIPLSIVDANVESNLSTLSKNILAYVPNRVTFDRIKIKECNTYEDELRYVLNKIKYAVVNGDNYSDYAIVVPNTSNFMQSYAVILNEYDMPYYIDNSDTMDSVCYARFILNILSGIETVLDKNIIFDLINTPFINASIDDKNNYKILVSKFGFVGNKLLDDKMSKFNTLYPFLLDLSKYYETCKKKMSVDEYINALQTLLNSAGIESNEKVNENILSADILQYKKDVQVQKKLLQIFENLSKVMGGYICDATDFANILRTYISSTNINYLPVSVDSLVILDCQNSFLGEYKHLFIVGANDGYMPATISDDALISDDDIDALNPYNKISPTVNFINKKNRFKIFDNIFHFSDDLCITYSRMSAGEKIYPAGFVVSMQNILGDQCTTHDNALLNLYNLNTVKRKYLDAKKINNANVKVLEKLLNDKINNMCASNNLVAKFYFDNQSKKLFSDMQKISVSQLESYNGCPYKYFINYGLKLNTIDDDKINAIDNGNILHEYLYFIVPIIYSGDYENIQKLSIDTLNKVLSKDNYSFIVSNPKNQHLLFALYNEAIRISNGILYQKQYTSFVPKYYEQTFLMPKMFDYQSNLLDLYGKVDRIDVFNNYFRIIDYKTGNTKFDNYNDLYLGKKLQLILYLESIKQKLNKQCGGAMYLPISNKFVSTGSNAYMLNGIMNKNIEVLHALDNRLASMSKFKSDIVDLKTDKNGELDSSNSTYSNMCLSDEEIDELIKINKHIANITFEKIMSNKFMPKPIYENDKINECAFCEYRAMCCSGAVNIPHKTIDKNITDLQELKEAVFGGTK